MVVTLPIVTIFTVGILASVVKVFHYEFQKFQMEKKLRLHQNNNALISPESQSFINEERNSTLLNQTLDEALTNGQFDEIGKHPDLKVQSSNETSFQQIPEQSEDIFPESNTTATSKELSTTVSATILINGKSFTFMKDQNQPFAHYDLAIDYCLNNAKELGLSLENMKSCIYPLSSIINQEFLETAIQPLTNDTSSRAIIEKKPKELVLSILPKGNERNSNSTDSVESTHDRRDNKDNPVQIILEINGMNYIFEFIHPCDVLLVAEELANNFCIAKGKELLGRYLQEKKITSAQEINVVIYEKCFQPLQNVLIEKINQEEQRLHEEDEKRKRMNKPPETFSPLR